MIHEFFKVTANLPSKGEYGIEVYGNDPAKDGDTYTHICQYYVHFATPNEQQQAFYQESPERRAAMGGPGSTTAAPGGYSGGSAGVGTVQLLCSAISIPISSPYLLHVIIPPGII